MVRYFALFVVLGCVYSTGAPPVVVSDRFVVTAIRTEWTVIGDPCECIPGRAGLTEYLSSAQTAVSVGTPMYAPPERTRLSLPLLYAGDGVESLTVSASDGSPLMRDGGSDRHPVWARTATTRVVQLGHGVATRGEITRPHPDTIQFEGELSVDLLFLDPNGLGRKEPVAAGGRAIAQRARLVIRATYERESI